jgi:biofilm PGA synthesis N-glycosyltransferase PgaC
MSTNGLAYMVLANSETGEGMIASRGSTTQDTGSTGLVPRYVIVSPVRDEQDNIERAIQCVMRQSVRPTEWIIVNDGSRDQTGRILDEYSIREPWIRVIHRKDRGYRKSGTGVMEAFHDGYGVLQTRDWDFLVKLDGDLSFTEDYFALCFKRFQQNPKLGLGGGTILSQGANGLTAERSHDFHVRGATKIYRRECWDAIGGLIHQTGWDTWDEVKANMLGWETLCFADITLVQHRHTGAADGTWKNAVKNGRANYVCGYHPLFMFLKCAKRIFQHTYFLSSFGLMTGYLSGYIFRIPRIEDDRVIRYLRKQQMKRLTFSGGIWK